MSYQWIFEMRYIEDLILCEDEARDYLLKTAKEIQRLINDENLEDTYEKIVLASTLEGFFAYASNCIESFNRKDFFTMIELYTKAVDLIYKLCCDRGTAIKTIDLLRDVVLKVIERFAITHVTEKIERRLLKQLFKPSKE